MGASSASADQAHQAHQSGKDAERGQIVTIRRDQGYRYNQLYLQVDLGMILRIDSVHVGVLTSWKWCGRPKVRRSLIRIRVSADPLVLAVTAASEDQAHQRIKRRIRRIKRT